MRGFFKRGQIGKTDLEKEGIIAATGFGRYYWPQINADEQQLLRNCYLGHESTRKPTKGFLATDER